MKSPTGAFEDAEIAREECNERDALSKILFAHHISDFAGDTMPEIAGMCDLAADAILAAGYIRQSPASTTAADAWDEGYESGKRWGFGRLANRPVNPYRVAAPEGDGGNE